MRLAIAALLFASACRPDFGAPDLLVSDMRILAVQATPAEVRPGESAMYRALVGSPSGAMAAADLTWAFCTAPKPLSENNVVPPACLGDDAVAPSLAPA
jgi:hypothetical protein